ncbi:MAG: 2,5-diamino-6-(ribosylamino)-4(3H)-pyrimidinone 5'-phosphate reductase [Candidatus Thermoplasmatota archaeon]|nr:2,5-diamino-6-(ribosylamino)-4(3H)-pyrimidinone 5'-phosphate reductase [Candidatus Thermoplasmatota archaeon]
MKRPHVTVNCAMSADGKIALPTRAQMRISCDEDIKRMYRLRHQSDAVLVGVGTILTDDPKLTVKEQYVPHPKQPLRVVLDSKARTPAHAQVLNSVAKTLIITGSGKTKRFTGSHIEVVSCKTTKSGLLDLHQVVDLLWQRGVRSVLVEGGGTVIWECLHHQIVDDMYIYIGPYVIGGKHTPTVADGTGIKDEQHVIPLRLVTSKRLGPGVVLRYQPVR